MTGTPDVATRPIIDPPRAVGFFWRVNLGTQQSGLWDVEGAKCGNVRLFLFMQNVKSDCSIVV